MKKNISKNVLLVNDTSNNHHHGCEIVMKNLENLLNKNNLKITKRVKNGINWLNEISILNNLKNIDIVIVNGEGSIHHNQKIGLDMIKIAEYAKKYNKPAVLINCTYEGNSFDYRKYLNFFDIISVRENFSYEELKKINISSLIVPDLIFYFDLFKDSFYKKSNKIIVSDSNILEVTNKLFHFYKKNKNYLYIPMLRNGIKLIHKDYFLLKKIKYYFIKSIFKFFKFEPNNNDRNRYYGVGSAYKYFEILKQNNFLVSGRFHSTCFAIITKTPFLAIKSNTFKIESLIEDIQLNKERLIDLNYFSNNIIDDKSNFIKYKFSVQELQNIDKYVLSAKDKIENLFKNIRKLVDNEK